MPGLSHRPPSHRSFAPKTTASGSRLRAVVTMLWMMVLLVCPLVARPAVAGDAFALRGDELVVVDLESGTITEIGSHHLNAYVLAYSPDRVLYTVGKRQGVPENPYELWILDQETGERTQVGNPGVNLPGDLTFDDSGDLWVAAGGQLHSVDPSSGEATQVGAEAGFLQGLADFNGQLYGIESEDVVYGGPPWRLVEVDKATAASTTIAPLPAFDDQEVLTMDFDSSGRLWILAVNFIPEPFTTKVFRSDDPFSGEIELVFELETSYTVEGLVLIPPPLPIEVPLLDGAGAAMLVVLLLVAAWWRIHRQRRSAG